METFRKNKFYDFFAKKYFLGKNPGTADQTRIRYGEKCKISKIEKIMHGAKNHVLDLSALIFFVRLWRMTLQDDSL